MTVVLGQLLLNLALLSYSLLFLQSLMIISRHEKNQADARKAELLGFSLSWEQSPEGEEDHLFSASPPIPAIVPNRGVYYPINLDRYMFCQFVSEINLC